MRSSPVVPPLLALTLLTPTACTPLTPTRPELHEPMSGPDVAKLERARATHDAFGRRTGRGLGLTTDWARTRWVPGATLGEVHPLFHVTVASRCPVTDVHAVVVDRLGHLGWGGRTTACSEELRIEGHRHGCELVLLADGATITVTLRGAGLVLPRTQVLHLICGAYEDECPDEDGGGE